MNKLWKAFKAVGSIASVVVLAFMLYGATSGNINWTQIRSSDRHGTDTKGQSSDGTGTSGNLAKFNASGGLTDGGVAASGVVNSVTGDSNLVTNSSSTGAVTLTLHTAPAYSYWGNNTGSTAAPAYSTIPAAAIPATPLATGTSHTFSGNNDYFICTSTCTITVPVPAAGVQYCVANDDNVSTVITLSAIGSSSLYENTARTAYGTAGTGTAVSGGAVGDKLCIVGRDATHYLSLSFQGTWTMS